MAVLLALVASLAVWQFVMAQRRGLPGASEGAIAIDQHYQPKMSTAGIDVYDHFQCQGHMLALPELNDWRDSSPHAE